MLGDGRREADRISVACLAGAAAWATLLASHGTDRQASRAVALAEALEFLSGGESPAPRTVGLPVLLLARHAASVLSADIGNDPYAPTGTFDAACRVHDELDAVATALGGLPDLIPQDDEWGMLAEEESEPVLCAGLSETAGTASLFARDALSHVISVPGPAAAHMRRDAGIAVGACLVLRSALADQAGTPGHLVRPVASIAADALSRLLESARGWRGLDAPELPGRLLDDLSHVADATRALVGEIEAEIAPSPV